MKNITNYFLIISPAIVFCGLFWGVGAFITGDVQPFRWRVDVYQSFVYSTVTLLSVCHMIYFLADKELRPINSKVGSVLWILLLNSFIFYLANILVIEHFNPFEWDIWYRIVLLLVCFMNICIPVVCTALRNDF